MVEYVKKPKWWETDKTPAALVVNHFGGPSKTAKALSRSIPSVSKWYNTGRVPSKLWPLVVKKTRIKLETLAGIK